MHEDASAYMDPPKPFVTALIEAGNPREALAFIEKVEPSDKRFALQRRLNEILSQTQSVAGVAGR